MIAQILDYIRGEPAVLSTLAGIAISIGARYGFDLTVDQVTGVFGVVLLLVSRFVTRAAVYSPKTVDELLEHKLSVDELGGGDDEEEAP